MKWPTKVKFKCLAWLCGVTKFLKMLILVLVYNFFGKMYLLWIFFNLDFLTTVFLFRWALLTHLTHLTDLTVYHNSIHFAWPKGNSPSLTLLNTGTSNNSPTLLSIFFSVIWINNNFLLLSVKEHSNKWHPESTDLGNIFLWNRSWECHRSWKKSYLDSLYVFKSILESMHWIQPSYQSLIFSYRQII